MKNYKKWAKAAGVRAVRTFFQSAGSLITVGLTVGEHNWKYIASVSFVSAIYSVVTSLAGLPEVKDGE